MPLNFYKTPLPAPPHNVVRLHPNNWDDFSFKTKFDVSVYDSVGRSYELGEVKIGYVGQPHGWTEAALPDTAFLGFPEGYFSLGQSVEYYTKIREMPLALRNEYLSNMRDVVHDPAALASATGQQVFRDSLMRGVSFTAITEQFKRILDGGSIRTEFHFVYQTEATNDRAAFRLSFDIDPALKPSSNIHVLIGRNGTGKTTLLNGMIAALTGERPLREGIGQFFDTGIAVAAPLNPHYFNGVISVSFSAFDPFTPPLDQARGLSEFQYSYIGLKRVFMHEGVLQSDHKNMDALSEDFAHSLIECYGVSTKRERWDRAIEYLESDLNFEEMDLHRLMQGESTAEIGQRAKHSFLKMSSGHAIVLLTITKLVERIEEKTLLLMDEPESHLHPPLLSAFTRALADLLHKMNGIAIIATHSPVILQEVPQNCVWKLYRSRLVASTERTGIETFAENVGILTREVFSLEVQSSGFHNLLIESVNEGKTFDQIISEYQDHIGFEGKAILRALISNRARAAGQT